MTYIEIQILKKYLLIIILINIFYTTTYSQGQQPIDAHKLTEVLPPGPNAFELTRYAGLPVNLSSGSVSATIPLGSVQFGKSNLPISLNYNSGNGILLNQIASRVGMSWTLDAGGVITRSVSGNPDESSNYITTPAQLNMNTQEVYQYFDLLSSSNIADSQADIFSFNFNGVNGKFIFEKGNENKIILLNAAPLKIETNFNNSFPGDWTFRITDELGTRYYFGGSKATEKSRTSPAGPSCGRNYDQAVPTAWYLISVVDVNNNTIRLDYTSCNFEYSASVTQSFVRTPSKTARSIYCQPCSTCPPSYCPTRTEEQLCTNWLLNQGKILKTITSKNHRVEFLYGDRSDIEGDSLLTNVKFYERKVVGTDTILASALQTYTLTFVNSFNDSYKKPTYVKEDLRVRPFLKSIKRSSTGMQDELHVMDYYNVNSLAARLSFAQDYWGYFNGKNNSNLVPSSTNPEFKTLFPSNLADRNPNGSFAHFGLLQKIAYPSKGSDSLIYEPNTYYGEKKEAVIATKSITIEGTGSKGEVSTEVNFTNKKSQTFNFSVSCVYSGSGINDEIHQGSTINLYNSSNVLLESVRVKIGQSNNIVIYLDAGNFRLELISLGQAARGYAGFSFWDGEEITLGNFQAGGVRLQKKISSPLNGQPMVRKYVYTSLSNQVNSSGVLKHIPSPDDYYAALLTAYPCSYDILLGVMSHCLYLQGTTTSIYPLEYFSGGHITYKDVIELEGEDWAKGGSLHRFMGNAGSFAAAIRGFMIPSVQVGNIGFEIGTPFYVQKFITTGGSSGAYLTKPIKEITTTYHSDDRLSKDLHFYVVQKKWQPEFIQNPPIEEDFTVFDVARYTLSRKWTYPDTVTTIDYDKSGNSPVTTKEVYVYNDTNHMQLSQIKTLSSDGGVEVLNTSYPLDYPNTSGFLADMKAYHLIAYPIEQVKYKGLGSNQKITFGRIIKYKTGKGALVDESLDLESSQAISKSSFKFSNRLLGQLPPLQGVNSTFLPHNRYRKQISFDQYDVNGNLLQFTIGFSKPVTYLWGYSGQYPIAKIENATYAEVLTALGTSATTILNSLNAANVSAATIATHTDTLRTKLRKATVVSYTYEPLVGMTSMTDPRGITEYYKYDGFQRLKDVLDFESNILKNYQYHYRTN